MDIDHLSWSQMNTVEMCGERYRRRYGLKDIVPPGIALPRGKATHKSIEKNLTSKMETGSLLSMDEVYATAGDAFDAYTEDGAFVCDGPYEDMPVEVAVGKAKDEAVALAGLHATDVAPQIAPTAVEQRIEVAPSEVLPVTFVSILDSVDNGITIRDVKTSQRSPGSAAANESEQLTGQELAFRAEYGKESAGLALDYLVMTPKKGDLKYIHQETQRTDEDINVFLHRAQAVLRSIEAEVFLPAPVDHWTCSPRFCGYFDTCKYAAGRKRPTT
jgi:hypothetical protein